MKDRGGTAQRTLIQTWLRLVVLLAMAVCGTGASEGPAVPYVVEFQGVTDAAMRTGIEEVSDTVALGKRPPATLTLLRQRVERDVPRLVDVLKARGYYAAQVAGEVDEAASPVRVVFRVTPGPAYGMKSVDVQLAGVEPGCAVRTPDPEALGLRAGEPARSRAILKAETALIDSVRRQGYPFAKVDDRRVVVDHAARNVVVAFRLAPGPAARFAPTTFAGQESVNEAFLQSTVPWKDGDRYNSALLDEFERRLLRLGLFATVKVVPGEALDATGGLPVAVYVTERKHRTVGAGVGYRTDEGARARVSWEHRNLLHGGEHLQLNAAASEIGSNAEIEFRKPAFLRPDQSLVVKLRLARDLPDAFESSSLSSEATLERTLSDRLHVGEGIALRHAAVKQFRETRHFDLLSLPGYVDWDHVDNAFDPGEGERIRLRLAPYFDLSHADFAFLKSVVEYSTYLRLSKSPDVVLAGHIQLGSLLGAGRWGAPADERFYAGGGGSVRGYPYQSIGPVRGGDPVGGRSLVEFGCELRYKLTERLGFVTFLDGGAAMTSALPDLGEPLRLGAGVGVRYYTGVGPLRFDIAVPINPPDHVSERFQVYLSLGHAF